MQIPLLKNSFGCYSLRTGTLIIAYFTLVMDVIVVVGLLLVFVLLENFFGEKTKSTSFMENVNYGLPSNDENKLKTVVIGIGAVVIGFIAIILLIQFTALMFLFQAVKQRRPGYMHPWLVLSVISLIISITGAIDGMKGVLVFALNLYFTWVVYSYYRQLKDNPDSNVEVSMAEARGVKTNEISPSAPPPYVYAQK